MKDTLVKFNGQWWLVHDKKGQMLILWRDGQRAFAHVSKVEKAKENKNE